MKLTFLWTIRYQDFDKMNFYCSNFETWTDFLQNNPNLVIISSKLHCKNFLEFYQNLSGLYSKFTRNSLRIHPKFLQNLPEILSNSIAIWLHFSCILTAFWLHFEWNSTAFWMNFDWFFDWILTEFWLNFDWILTEFWLQFDCNFNCILTEFWLNFD